MSIVESTDDLSERPVPRAQIAADQIRAMIANGQLRPGDRVNELSIAKSLGMSRGPIREAVRRLSSSGLLIEEANVGARVIAPDEVHVRELFLVRELLESQAAMEAAEKMSEEERDHLKVVLDSHEMLLEGDRQSPYPYESSNEDFHKLVLKGSRNTLISRICGNDLWDIFLVLRGRHDQRTTRGREALKEHRQIAEAVIDGNGELAALLMRQHIRRSRDVFHEMMQSSAPVDDTPHDDGHAPSLHALEGGGPVAGADSSDGRDRR